MAAASEHKKEVRGKETSNSNRETAVATVSLCGSPAAKYGADSARVSSLTTQVSLKDIHLTVPVCPCNVKYLKFQ